MPTSTELELLLRGASLRVTRQRLAVLGAVHAHPHADTDSIIGAVRAAVGDNYHHVACRSCGTIADVDCAVDGTPCLTEHTSHQQVPPRQEEGTRV